MRTTWYTAGEWKAVCDRCGFHFRNTQLKLEWDGLMVCNGCWEPRHPQDMIRPIPDSPALPWTRPDPAAGNADLESYVQSGFCTVTNRQGIADFGGADCAQADVDLGYREIPDFI